jgi:hypothetical protein
LDEFSTAQVDVVVNPQFYRVLSIIDPLATELSLLRNGVEVWTGPIVAVEYGRSTGYIQAQDLSAWLNWRVVHTDISSPDPVNLGELAVKLIEDALEPDNPNIRIKGSVSNNSGVREYLASDFLISSSELDEILRTDIDMVVVGRTIYLFHTEAAPGNLPDFSDDSFVGDLRVRRDGIGCATRVILNGSDSLWSTYPPFVDAGSARYGLKERVFNETSILDQVSLDLAAKSRYDLIKTPVVKLFVPDGSRLSPSCNVDINQLIPGFKQKVVSTRLAFPVSATFRLKSVSVDVSDKTEEVKVSYSQIGSVVE